MFCAHHPDACHLLLIQVLDIVADRTREIVNMGVPIPEHIPFNLDNVIPKDHNRKLHSATQLSESTMN